MSSSEDENFSNVIRATFLEEAGFLVSDTEQALLELEKTDDKASSLAKIFRAMHSIKGSASAVGFLTSSSFAHCLEDCLAILRAHPKKISAPLITILLEGVDYLKSCIDRDASGKERKPDYDEACKKIKDMTLILEKEVQSTLELGDTEPSGKLKHDATKAAPSGESGARLLKINSDRIDAVLSLVGELVVIKSQLIHSSCVQKGIDSESAAIVNLLERTVRELYERSLAMRMTSLQSLFMKVQRSVRDLSARLEKPVHLSIEGEATELDRMLIEQLGDPLVHLCRNALDHGIEDQATRLAQGKAPEGHLRMSATRKGAQVIIEVTDDGKGIDPQKILSKARAVGLADPHKTDWTDKEIYDFIYMPGFSTANAITDVSGRGVGLDVVRSNVEALKGSVETISQIGKGTIFRIIVPLTTAIADGMVVTAADQKYILPVDIIREFIKLDASEIREIERGIEVVEVHGSFLPLVRLSEALADTPSNPSLLIVIDVGKQRAALAVDQVDGQSQVVLKSLESAFGRRKGLAGAAILGDGRVAIVLDVESLLLDTTSARLGAA